MRHYERPIDLEPRVESLRVPAETKEVLRWLLQRTDREVHVSRSTESKVRPVWTFSLAPPLGDVQIAVALNAQKVTIYIKARNPRGMDVRGELAKRASIEQQYPNPAGREPPSFFSVQGVAPGLQPDAADPLLRIAPQAGRALDVLEIHLGFAAGSATSAPKHSGRQAMTSTPEVLVADTIIAQPRGSADLNVALGGEASTSGVMNHCAILPEDDESAFPEGTVAYKLHRSLERDSDFSKRVKQARLNDRGKLACEVCEFDFADEYGACGIGYIEAHHKVPVHKLDGASATRAEDLALVCSNCHRMLHRGNPQFTVEELRSRRLLARK